MDFLTKKYGEKHNDQFVLGVLLFTIISAIVVFAIMFAYEFTMYKYFISSIFLDVPVTIFAIWITSRIADLVIRILKIENAKAFSRAIVFSAIVLTFFYYFGGLVAAVVYFADITDFSFKYLISIFPIAVNRARYFGDAQLSYSAESLFNYVFAALVFIGFAIPRGKFNFNRSIYINGEKVKFKRHVLFRSEPIAVDHLSDIELLNEIAQVYELSKKDTRTDFLVEQHYYSLFISENPNYPVFAMIKGTAYNHKRSKSLSLPKRQHFYYDINFNVDELLRGLRPYSDYLKVNTLAVSDINVIKEQWETVTKDNVVLKNEKEIITPENETPNNEVLNHEVPSNEIPSNEIPSNESDQASTYYDSNNSSDDIFGAK